MKKITLEVELHPDHAKLLKELIEDEPTYLSNILTQHLTRKQIYGGIKERKESGD